MREIKFRAWNPDRKKIEDEFDITSNGNPFKINMVETFEEKDSWILQQYTGLKDRNGKEIYEGDILDYSGKPWVVQTSDNGAWILDYANGSGQCYLHPICSHLEIIGNIYENPELA